ncbi:MAG: pseudouridylate synthase [Flavobacterium sp. BFFFF2]|nr:MAG: pseudouridylate synthase [Flavobacterium sp. BFFFF2]
MRTPQPGKFSPKGSKPGSSKGSKPGSPAGRKPSGFNAAKPTNGDDRKVGKFDSEKPNYSEDRKPSGFKTGKFDKEKPSYSEDRKPSGFKTGKFDKEKPSYSEDRKPSGFKTGKFDKEKPNYAEGRKSAAPFSKFAPRAPRKAAPKQKDEADGIRLNKYIANSGVCSRREADIYIQSGNVKVNQTVINELGYKVMPGDQVFFDGAKVNPEKPLYILLNKPKNFSTAGTETGATRQVMELIKLPAQSSARPLGRMDKNTTGLLLITNDTMLHQKYALPSPRAAKIYQVSLDKNLRYEDFEAIEKGLVIEGHRVNVDEISYIDGEAKSEIGIKLKSTNIRIVRSIFEHFNYDVLRVDRVMLAGLTKKNLARGQWRDLDQQEIINLKNMF